SCRAALADRYTPGHQKLVTGLLEPEIAPLEEPGEDPQDRETAVRLARGRAAGGMAADILYPEGQLAPDAVAAHSQLRHGAGTPVAHGIRDDLAEKPAEAAADRTGEFESRRPVG